MHGSELRKLRKDRGVTAVWVAERMGLKHRQRVTQLEDKEHVSVAEFVAYTDALGLKAGDLLPNTGGVRADLLPLVELLESLSPAVLLNATELLRTAERIAQAAALPDGLTSTRNVSVSASVLSASGKADTLADVQRHRRPGRQVQHAQPREDERKPRTTTPPASTDDDAKRGKS